MSSRTIDERIVEMRFDNRQFESNVQTSLSTLDRLKQSLNLNGAAKGLEGLGSAARKCDLSPLARSAETVRAKFSAMEVVAMSALSNITNSVVNAGRRMISSFTVEPITTGFNEYELKMGSIQTIMAGTGESLDRVNQKLDELNTYSDRTIYSFSDMTSSIGKFTNAGVKLDDAVAAIQGISNEAAVSGANAQQASHAMYNFAQALSSGAVKLIDWKSIENANMATVEFKNELIKTAVELGTLVEIDGQYKTTTTDLNGKVSDLFDSTRNFNDSLAHQWMTTDVLVKTLGRYADETTEIGKKAFAAAQDVKTFSQLMDTLKESAQSGWAETWQLFVGDFEEAKVTLTEFSELFGDMISRSADSRNALLGGALMSGWGQLKQEVNEAGFSVDTFTEALRATASESVDGFEQMMEKAGSFEKTLSQGWLTTDILTKALDRMANEATETSGGISALTDEQLKNTGYTEGQIAALRSLADQADTSTGKIAELVQNMTRKSGRELLFDSLLNSAKGVQKVFGALKGSWAQVFPPVTSEQLYGLIEGLHRFSEKLVISDETADKLGRTFKGLFAALDLVRQPISALLRTVSPLIGGLTTLSGGILDVTAAFGDWLVGIDEAAKQSDIFNKVCQRVSGFIIAIASNVKEFSQTIRENFKIPGFEAMQDILGRAQERMGQVVSSADEMRSGLRASMKGIAAELANSKFMVALRKTCDGIKTIAKTTVNVVGELTGGIVDKLKDSDFNGALDLLNGISFGAISLGIAKFLKGIEKPFEELDDLLDGVKGILDEVRGCFEAYQTQLKAGTLLKIASAIAILAAAILTISLIDSDKLAASLGAVTVLFADLMGSMAIFSRISGDIKGVTKTCAAMIAISTAVLILASALRKIGGLDMKQLAIGLTGITGMMASLVAAIKILSGNAAVKGAVQMVIFAEAIKILASVCTDLAGLEWVELAKGLTGVGVLLAEVSLFLNTAKLSGKSITTATGIVILSAALKVLASACKDFGQMNWEEIGKGLASIGALLLEIATFTNLAGSANHVVSTGLALIEIAAAMKIFASAMADFKTMGWEEIGKGLAAMGGALAAVAVSSRIMPKNMLGIGTGLIAVGAALEIVADALGKMGSMSWEEIGKGLTVLGVSLTELAIALKLMNGTLAGSAAMVVAAGALALLTPVLVALGSMSWASIAKGLVSIAGTFAVFGAAGYLLGPVVPVIAAVSASISLLAVSLAAFIASITALNVTGALSALAAPFQSLADHLGLEYLKSLVGLIPDLLIGLVNAFKDFIIAFCAVVIEGAPAIGAAIKALVLTFVDVLVECAPTLIAGALELLAEVLDALVNYTPQIIDALISFLIEVINGVTRHMPALIQAGVNLLAAFFSGVIDALSGIDTGTLLKSIAGIGLLTAIIAALGAAASMIPAAMVGVLGMGAVIAELALVLAAVGALAQIPGLSWLVGEGGKLMGEIGTAIGSFIGGIVGGTMSGVSGQFPQIGSDLSAFMTNVQPFINGANSIRPDMLAGIKTLTGAILQLTAAELLDGLTSWITGGSSLSGFAEQLVPFGDAMSSFSKSIAGMDAGLVTKAAAAGKTLAEMAKTLPNSGGVIGFFTGNTNMKTFGEQIAAFGGAMVAFSNKVKGMDANAVSNAAVAGKTLAEMAKALPNSGGVVGFFTGNNDISNFAKQVVPFGEGLRNYSLAVKDLDLNAVNKSVTAGKALADLGRLVKGIDRNAFTNFSNSLSNLGNISISGFTDAFANCDQKINNAILKMMNSIKSAIAKNKSSADSSMEKVMNSLAKVVDEKATSMSSAIGKTMTGFSKAIRDNGKSVKSAMNTVLTETVAAINKSKGSFTDAGRNVSQGFINGINSKLSDAGTAGRNLGLAALNAAKKALDSHSPSREFIHLGEYIGEGLAIGVNNSIVPAAQAASKMIDEVIRVSAKGIDAFKEWADEKKYYGELSLKDELAGYENLQKKYKEGSEKRKQIDREVYRLQNELVSATYQASIDWIEQEKYYNRLSLEQELAAWERVQARYLEGCEERKKADREVYRLRNELVAASYQYSMDWIEEEKYYNRMSLSDELAAYKRVQSRYAKGTDERKKMDREVYRLEKEISDAKKQYLEDVQRVQEETNQRRLDLEQEYADKVKSINEQLARDIQAANDAYESALESRTDALYRAYGLFDKVADRKDISGTELMENLQGQVTEFENWQDTLDSLSARGLSKDLIEELQKMGPSAISEIMALNSMSDSELEKYAALWSIKHALAREQATEELEGLRLETRNTIANLRADADRELDEYREVWNKQMSDLSDSTNEQLEQLKEDFQKTVGIIKSNTASEMAEMTATATAILKQAGWDETGKQIVNGLTGGVEQQKPSFIQTLTNMALQGVKAVKDVLGIKSPSKVFAEIGNFAGLGFVNALSGYADRSYDIASQVGNSAENGLIDSIGRIIDIINGGLDVQPSICPVLDLSNLTAGIGRMDGLLNSSRSIELAGMTKMGLSGEEKLNVTVQNDDVVRELQELRGDMAAMSDTIGRLKIVLDTGTLVGEMAGPMNAALGQRLVYEGRGI